MNRKIIINYIIFLIIVIILSTFIGTTIKKTYIFEGMTDKHKLNSKNYDDIFKKILEMQQLNNSNFPQIKQLYKIYMSYILTHIKYNKK